ncbi:MAG: hypothetical protein AAGA75_23035 [Cyanobacteria bacterium P01_E01_bin.6]
MGKMMRRAIARHVLGVNDGRWFREKTRAIATQGDGRAIALVYLLEHERRSP